ncbi:MAG: aerobic respiration control sensor protein ArcB [Deltaproteobacteria bacterium ADurb.Bin510]|nr:MAG: aerobic respiration control sensor protein ArcB [Deltaproteobacteria bacterium ADurb.Bin510]
MLRRPTYSKLQQCLTALKRRSGRGRSVAAELAAERHKLNERIKELDCLYSLSELISPKDVALEETLQAAVAILPPAWQYPAQTTARITLAGQQYLSASFREGRWCQTAEIPSPAGPLGTVEIFYSGELPPADEGPFLKEERALIEAVALKLGSFYQQHQAAAALRHSEAMYRSLADMMHDVVWTTDLDLKLTYLSPSVEKALGLKRQDLIGKTLMRSMSAESRSQARDLLQAEIARDNQPGIDPDRAISFECAYQPSGEATVWFENLATFIRDENGRACGLHGVSRDITERKQAALERERLIAELQQALSEVKALSGLLPICANCKKIRDDQGYISQHSQALFSHGICPDCARLLYPEFKPPK